MLHSDQAATVYHIDPWNLTMASSRLSTYNDCATIIWRSRVRRKPVNRGRQSLTSEDGRRLVCMRLLCMWATILIPLSVWLVETVGRAWCKDVAQKIGTHSIYRHAQKQEIHSFEASGQWFKPRAMRYGDRFKGCIKTANPGECDLV